MDDFTKGFFLCLILSIIINLFYKIIEGFYKKYKVDKENKERGYWLRIEYDGKIFKSFEEFETYKRGKNV